MDDKEYAEKHILPDGRTLAEAWQQQDEKKLNEWGALVLPHISESEIHFPEEQALREQCFVWMMTSLERGDPTILRLIGMMNSQLEAASVSYYTGKSSSISQNQRMQAAKGAFEMLFSAYRAGNVLESNVQ